MFAALCTWVTITAASVGNSSTIEQQLLCRPAPVQVVRLESYFSLSKRLKKEATQARMEKLKSEGKG